MGGLPGDAGLLSGSLRLSGEQARRAAVSGALLAQERPASLVDTVRGMGAVQMDPIAVVARAERLVLFSRLGAYDPAALDAALFQQGALFEYAAFIVPMADYPLHREAMRRYPRGDGARARYVREWLRQNRGFSRYVIGRLRRDGPLRSRDLDDRAAVPWRTGGWNDGKNVGSMLEILWKRGRIATVGRDGAERIWDLAERRYPTEAPRPATGEEARRLLDRQLLRLGVSRAPVFGHAFDGRPPSWRAALAGLVRDGVVIPAEIEGLGGGWYAHRDALAAPFAPRTVLLCPFDRLVYDRDRAARLFGFRYRLEIYVPAAEREFGYYVLPILHGDRLIGRIDPRHDRDRNVLVVRAVFAEQDAPRAAGAAVAGAIAELGSWLGAEAIEVGETPAAWRAALRGV